MNFSQLSAGMNLADWATFAGFVFTILGGFIFFFGNIIATKKFAKVTNFKIQYEGLVFVLLFMILPFFLLSLILLLSNVSFIQPGEKITVYCQNALLILCIALPTILYIFFRKTTSKIIWFVMVLIFILSLLYLFIFYLIIISNAFFEFAASAILLLLAWYFVAANVWGELQRNILDVKLFFHSENQKSFVVGKLESLDNDFVKLIVDKRVVYFNKANIKSLESAKEKDILEI